MRNNRKITRYIERIARIHDEQSGDLNVADVTRLLALLTCLKAELTAYLRKMKL
jgi:hypothetical protein